MKTITNEIKAKILFQYIGADCEYKWDREPDILLLGKLTLKILESMYYDDKIITHCCVKLKPLSQISDEDAIEVAKYRYKDPKYMTFLNIGKSIIRDYLNRGLADNNGMFCLELFEIDYLRSKGYALSYLYYSIDDLVKLGVYKLI